MKERTLTSIRKVISSKVRVKVDYPKPEYSEPEFVQNTGTIIN
jgi:hypothetical protein